MWTLPNILTVARICLAPVVALLPFINGSTPKILAFVVFLIAAFSDAFDGWYARRYQLITDLGKLLDPLADKLLLLATLVPIFWMTRHPTLLTDQTIDYQIPWWGSLPVWVAILLLGRELLMTLFRAQAKKRGVIIAANRYGKLKTIFQNCFIGGTIAWFAWKDLLVEMRWTGPYRDVWNEFHGTFIAVTLGIAVVLTAWSLAVYLYQYRSLLRVSDQPAA
jgi:CDP-diacylglycerol---glycerol-3-phosphate 3-phosphatidyltransferase